MNLKSFDLIIFICVKSVFSTVPAGSIDVTVDNAQELMVAADMLQLSEVVAICGEFLRGQMDATNCVGFFQFLEQIACMDLLEFTENFIHVHFLEVRCDFLSKSLCLRQIYVYKSLVESHYLRGGNQHLTRLTVKTFIKAVMSTFLQLENMSVQLKPSMLSCNIWSFCIHIRCAQPRSSPT